MQKPEVKTKRVTIEDVARVAGISKSTASRALNSKGSMTPQTRATVRRVARRLGFEANAHAQCLANGRSNNTIGFFSPDLDLSVGTRKMQDIQHLLGERGYVVPIHAFGYRQPYALINQAQLLADLRRQRPRALVCNNSNLREAAARAELLRYCDDGGLAVCYDWPLEVPCDMVVFDREDATYCATRHLLELGHRRLGFFINATYGAEGPDGTEPHRAGFLRALREWNIEPREEWMFPTTTFMQVEKGGVGLASLFLALRERPTGMCIVNDAAALTFMGEVGRAGLHVPHDVSVIGHDNTMMARHGPRQLSSVTHPVLPIACSVVEMLDSRLNGRYDGEPRKEVLRCELVVRDSTAPPREA
ncbi:MAG: LacI family transcriptional regulator [Abditibacteriota bacterium]|nr:LacI family transcriptional regulator [Abditibacteriota bacterium]